MPSSQSLHINHGKHEVMHNHECQIKQPPAVRVDNNHTKNHIYIVCDGEVKSACTVGSRARCNLRLMVHKRRRLP